MAKKQEHGGRSSQKNWPYSIIYTLQLYSATKRLVSNVTKKTILSSWANSSPFHFSVMLNKDNITCSINQSQKALLK